MERVKIDLAAERTGPPGDSTGRLRSNQGSRKSSDLECQHLGGRDAICWKVRARLRVARLGAGGSGDLGSL